LVGAAWAIMEMKIIYHGSLRLKLHTEQASPLPLAQDSVEKISTEHLAAKTLTHAIYFCSAHFHLTLNGGFLTASLLNFNHRPVDTAQ
ncbi:MAG: hypothetical protein NTV80_11605, partial [Verrucomicrobia bacterium]|nr:hypothetical protein [Verrucomicrobiota bacterium]